MALTSRMLPLGTVAPDFTLPDVDGQPVSLAAARARAFVVMFICNHCPFVKHVAPALAALGRDYAGRDVAIFAINANDPERYPEDSPEKMAAEKAARGYVFPYLFDETQAVARAYQAACTPDFFVFDANRALVYRGQLDDSRPGNDRPVTGADLRAAIDAVLEGRAVAALQKPSIGCGIKWKPGFEPPLA